MRTRYLTAFTVAAVVAIIVGDGAAAAALPGDGAAAAVAMPTRLRLTLATGEAATPAQRLALLTCAPAGGSHPRAGAACTALTAAGGDFAALHVTDGICTTQYAPVTVMATGRWKGRVVRYRHTFSNACVLRNETGPVFRI